MEILIALGIMVLATVVVLAVILGIVWLVYEIHDRIVANRGDRAFAAIVSEGARRARQPLDRELFDAFESGRLVPRNNDQREWYEAVKAGRLEIREL